MFSVARVAEAAAMSGPLARRRWPWRHRASTAA